MTHPIKHHRRAVGLTQSGLAAKVGVKRQTISHYELGIVTAPVKVAKRIAEVFGCDWRTLYDDSAPESSHTPNPPQ